MQISNYGIELFREYGCETRYSDHMRLKIGVIIPTKDRPQNVQKVLESFVGQEVNQVVVCGSGEDLTPVIEEFKNKIPIRYIKAESGQINQKLEAISQLDYNLDWVIFSDDDVVYPSDFFGKLHRILDNFSNSPNILGIGFRLKSKTHPTESVLKRLFTRFFGLGSGKPGAVRRNGVCIPYASAIKEFETQWLNGASVWRTNEILKYNSVDKFTKYAVYEDAIFSYARSKEGTLRFVPSLEIEYQANDLVPKLNAERYLAQSLWQIYFVVNFKLSLIKCAWSLLGVSLQLLKISDEELPLRAKTRAIRQVNGVLIGTLKSFDKETYIVGCIKKNLRAK